MKKLSLFLFLSVFTFAPVAMGQGKSKIPMPKKLTFGIYAPNTAFSSNSARWSYIRRVASYVQGLLKIPCSGRAYSSAGAFSGASGKLDFALVDPIYMARGGGALEH